MTLSHKWRRRLFAGCLGPVFLAIALRRKLMPRNFHGCRMVLGRYPKDLPLLHRMVYSWWIMPMDIYMDYVIHGFWARGKGV